MNTEIKNRFLTKYKNFEVGSNTYIQYDNQIKKLYGYVKGKEKVESERELINKIDGFMMEGFYYYLQEQKYRLSTINTVTICIKDYFKYLCDMHIIEKNYADILKKPKQKEIKLDKKEKDTLTVNEMKKIIECSYIRSKGERNFDFNSSRDRFLIALLFTTGLRISEALSIRLDWIEEVENIGLMINIPKKYVKNNMDKRVPIVDSIKSFYDEYIIERNKIKLKGKKLLFLSANGIKFDKNNSNSSINKLIKKAKIEEKHISNHCLRHSLTRQLVSNRVDISLIKKILGWNDDDISGIYSGDASDPTYDDVKMSVCDLFKNVKIKKHII